MACSHRHYILGSPKYANKWTVLSEFMYDMLYDLLWDNNMKPEWIKISNRYAEFDEIDDWLCERYEYPDYQQIAARFEERKGAYLYEQFIKYFKCIRNVYLYDHSGLTINLGGFDCPWDSGQVGWITMNPAAYDEWKDADVEQIRRWIEGNAEIYDDYLTGNVYGYDIEGDLCEDSCWGFYGDEGLKDIIIEAKASIDHAIEAEEKRRWALQFENQMNLYDIIPSF
jgi:hypothetical protein